MKKLLRFILALAMIISCVSMVSFVANAEETKTLDGLSITLSAKADFNTGTGGGLFDQDNSFTGTKVVRLAVRNVSDFAIAPVITINAIVKHQQDNDDADTYMNNEGWSVPVDSTNHDGKSSMCANDLMYMEFHIKIVEGQVRYKCYSDDPADTCENDVMLDNSWCTVHFDTLTVKRLYGDVYPDYSVSNKFEAANLEIGSSLTINYVVSFREGFEDSYLRITRNNDVRNVYGQLIAEGVYAGKYIFSYTGVNAQCMADIITAELVCGDAIMATGYADVYTLTITNNLTGISNVISYNVNAYISQKNTSASVGGIVTAMSNYGNAALAYRS